MDLSTGIAFASLLVSVVVYFDSRKAAEKAARFDSDQARWAAGREYLIALLTPLRTIQGNIFEFSAHAASALREGVRSPTGERKWDSWGHWTQRHKPLTDDVQFRMEGLWVHLRGDQVKRISDEWAEVYRFLPAKVGEQGVLDQKHFEPAIARTVAAVVAVMKEEGMHGDAKAA